jgi:predicted FMN-binding regulatory protein PaiB
MDLPMHFRESRVEVLQALMRACPFATLMLSARETDQP